MRAIWAHTMRAIWAHTMRAIWAHTMRAIKCLLGSFQPSSSCGGVTCSTGQVCDTEQLACIIKGKRVVFDG